MRSVIRLLPKTTTHELTFSHLLNVSLSISSLSLMQRFDRQQKGSISGTEFADACLMDQQLIESLENFYTII